MKRILVTGANGQLGKCLRDAAQKLDKKDYQFLFMSREQLDISNSDLIESWFFTNSVDWVVNCAAYTAVDLAETEVEKCFRINADAVGVLAKECAEQGAQFIHISTDYVFNGMSKEPFTEEDFTQPINVYGKAKLEGERLALENNPKTIILRTAWVYSQYGKNFLKTMLRLFKEKEEIAVVNDQFGTPTNANDIAGIIIKIITYKKNFPKGIYHFTNQGFTTWYVFAMAIKELTNSNIQINPIPTQQFPTPAERPQYSVLDSQKLQKQLDIQIPDWKTSLAQLFNEKL